MAEPRPNDGCQEASAKAQAERLRRLLDARRMADTQILDCELPALLILLLLEQDDESE